MPTSKKFIFILSKIKSHGRLIASSYDVCAVVIAWLLACWILIYPIPKIAIPFHLTLYSLYWKQVILNLYIILPAQFLLFHSFGLYRGFWRFASIQDLRKIIYVSTLGILIAWLVLWIHTKIFSIPLIPYITTLLYSLFLIALLSSARLFVRFAKNYKHLYGDCQRVIIVGAGNAGEGLIRDLLRDKSHHYKPIAIVDDDLRKQGREIHGIRIAGTIATLPTLISRYNINLVLIAIPSASSASMRFVVEICEKSNVRCYTLPGIKDLANGRVSIDLLRSISLDDLLGRYPVTCQWSLIKSNLQNKTILITGGGGSIGSELCRQIAALDVITRLLIADSNEYNLYAIDMELRQRFPSCAFHPLLLNITDRAGLKKILNEYQPQIVFHAAAYKHVPLLESQPRIAIYNNMIGTYILAEESTLIGSVEQFVLISTDKAVNPTNIMGATKRAAEYFCQNLNYHTSKTRFITVRFGNVLDSAGSVVPLFRKQIELGGPVTITHPEITRFFMTIPEASQLILEAAFLGQGGEIFVLDMGEPIKIRYLAEQMIKMAGKIVDQDIKISYIGLRPGEKLYEECFYPDESLQTTPHSKILRAKSTMRDFEEIQIIYHQLIKLCATEYSSESIMMELLKKLVPEYHASSEVYDINRNFSPTNEIADNSLTVSQSIV